MAWQYAFILLVVACLVTILSSLPPVKDEATVQAIFGRGDGGNSSRLPPLFAHRGAARYAPEYTLGAIQAAREKKADGIELDLSFTRDNVGVLFYDDSLERTTSGDGVLAHTSFADLRQLDAATKNPYAKNCRGCARVPTLEEGIQECLRQGLRFIVHVKRYDDRAVALLAVLFSQRPELYSQGLVSSPNPYFIYALRLQNPDIVTALTWRPGLLAYKDARKLRPRYDTNVTHYEAVFADWIFEQALNWGLLHYVTGASAVLVWKDNLNVDSVRMWRDRGVHVIAWTPNKRLEQDYFRRVLRVPIVTDSLGRGGRRKAIATASSWWPGSHPLSAIWTRTIPDQYQCVA